MPSLPRSLEHGMVLLALAPRLTRLSLIYTCDMIPATQASRSLQLLQHLKQLKHLTTMGPPEAADALNNVLLVRWEM